MHSNVALPESDRLGFRDDMISVSDNRTASSDNVGDDNGLRVTDGSVDPVSGMTRAIAFPYIAAPGNPPAGPNP